MANGSNGNRDNKGFDFAADDNILCSYEDYPDHDSSSNVPLPVSTKEFNKNRMESPIVPPSCSPPEGSYTHDVTYAVENTMKKYTDNVMRFLEGLSSRLSQLELYCYNLDKSVGEMRSNLERDQTEADLNLRSLDKHIQEVYRCVRILQEKQDVAETQKELAKIQLSKKETSSTSNSQQSEERVSASSTPDCTPNNMQLAIALPHQPQSATQPQAYYVPAQLHYVPSDSHYQPPQMQGQSQVSQAPPQHSLPQYQQQWVQQAPPHQQQMAPVHSSMQTQARPLITPVYSQYPPSQPTNPTPDPLPNSTPMQIPSYTDATSYVYVGPNRTMQQPQPQPFQQPPYGYLVYEGESGRQQNPPQHQQPHFRQGGGYAPVNASLQGPQANAGTNHMARPSQVFRGHPHGEVIEKLVNMGYRVDHVASVIQRLEESGQPVDFNAVLDRLNGGWSG